MIELHAIRTDTVRRTELSELKRSMPGRIRKADRYQQENDRLLCLGGGLLMYHGLGIRDESEIVLGPYGKPALRKQEKAFNLSHSGDWCLMTISGFDFIGVDIEQANAPDLRAAPVMFTQRELRWMNDAPADRFHVLWTWKESVMKALGLGLNLEPTSFEVLPFIRGNGIRVLHHRLYAYSGRLEGNPFSVCLQSPAQTLRGWEWRLTSGGFHPEPLDDAPFFEVAGTYIGANREA